MHIEGKVLSHEDVSAVIKKITAEIEWKEVTKELEKAYKSLQKNVNVRGFRQGKVPRAILEKQYGETVKAEAASELVGHFLENYLEEKQIVPVSAPIIESYNFRNGEALEFTAKIEARPTPELEKYRGIEIAERPVAINDEEVAGELERVRQMHAQIQAVEGRDITQTGDMVFFDIIELKDGVEGKKDTMNAIIGEGRMLPALEAKLSGQKIGEPFDVDLPMGKNAAEGETKRFRVKINEIKQKILPELNDDFAKDLGEFADLQALKEKITENITKMKTDRARSESEEELVREIIALNPFPIPESLVERQLKVFVDNFKERFGVKDVNMDQFKSEMSPRAQYVVQRAFILDAIAKREGIDASEDDVEAELKKIAKDSGRNVMWVKAQYEKDNALEDLKYQIRDRKVVDYLLGEAVRVQKPVDQEPKE